jgi:hypothetical protein
MRKHQPNVAVALEIFPGVSVVITPALAQKMNIQLPRPHRGKVRPPKKYRHAP